MCIITPSYDPSSYPHTPYSRHFFTKTPASIDGRWTAKRAAEKMAENIRLVEQETAKRAEYAARRNAKKFRLAELKEKLATGALTEAEATELAGMI